SCSGSAQLRRLPARAGRCGALRSSVVVVSLLKSVRVTCAPSEHLLATGGTAGRSVALPARTESGRKHPACTWRPVRSPPERVRPLPASSCHCRPSASSFAFSCRWRRARRSCQFPWTACALLHELTTAHGPYRPRLLRVLSQGLARRKATAPNGERTLRPKRARVKFKFTQKAQRGSAG